MFDGWSTLLWSRLSINWASRWSLNYFYCHETWLRLSSYTPNFFSEVKSLFVCCQQFLCNLQLTALSFSRFALGFNIFDCLFFLYDCQLPKHLYSLKFGVKLARVRVVSGCERNSRRTPNRQCLRKFSVLKIRNLLISRCLPKKSIAVITVLQLCHLETSSCSNAFRSAVKIANCGCFREKLVISEGKRRE